MEDETREMTPEEIKAAEEAEEAERKAVQETRSRCGAAVIEVLQALEPLVFCGDVARVLDTVEAFYDYTPLARARAFVTEAMETGVPIAAQLMPMVMQVADQFMQVDKADHEKQARRAVTIPISLDEVLRHMREAEAEAKPTPDLKDMLRQAATRAQAKREISEEEIVTKGLVQCQFCNATWPSSNGPCCPACDKPAY